MALFQDWSPPRRPAIARFNLVKSMLSTSSRESSSHGAAKLLSKDGAWQGKAKMQGAQSTVAIDMGRTVSATHLRLMVPDVELRCKKVTVYAVDPKRTGLHEVVSIDGSEVGAVEGDEGAGSGQPTTLDLGGAVCRELHVVLQGFVPRNTDRQHALCRLELFCLQEGQKVQQLQGVLGSLESFLAETAQPETTSDPAVRGNSLAALQNLCLSSASLSSMTSVLRALFAHRGPLGQDLARRTRAFLENLDRQYDDLCTQLFGGSARLGISASDSFKLEQGIGVTVSGMVATFSGGSVHCTTTKGIRRGKLEWKITVLYDGDPDDDCESMMYGICTNPMTNSTLEGSPEQCTINAYCGETYVGGNYIRDYQKILTGDTLRFLLDMDKGECRMWHNGVPFGTEPVFSGFKQYGAEFRPFIASYDEDRKVRFDYIKRLGAGSAKESEGASAGVTLYLSDSEPEQIQGTEKMLLGTGSMRTEDSTSPIVITSASRGELTTEHGLAVPMPEGAEGDSLTRLTYELDKGSSIDVFQATVGLCDPEKRRRKRSSRRGAPGDGADEGGPTGESKEAEDPGALESKEEDGAAASSGALESIEAEGIPASGAGADGGVRGDKAEAEALATMQFVLEGDGKRLWRSKEFVVPVAGQDLPEASPELDVQDVLVRISGVRKLALKVTQSVGTKDILPVWMDARVRHAPWLLERLDGKGLRKVDALKAAGPGASVPGVTAPTTGPVSALASPEDPLSEDDDDDYDVQSKEVTGFAAAEELLDILSLFCRQAAKSMQGKRPVRKAGTQPPPLELPFVVQCNGDAMGKVAQLLNSLRAMHDECSGEEQRNRIVSMLHAVLTLLNINFRRLGFAGVHPSEAGFDVAAPTPSLPYSSPGTGTKKKKKDRKRRKEAPSSPKSAEAQSVQSDGEDGLGSQVEAALQIASEAGIDAEIEAALRMESLHTGRSPDPRIGLLRVSQAAGGGGGRSESDGDDESVQVGSEEEEEEEEENEEEDDDGKAGTTSIKEGGAGPDDEATMRGQQARSREKASLKGLQAVLERLHLQESLPGHLRAEAAAVVDYSLPLFYPTTQDRIGLLRSCTNGGQEGVVELQLRWPVGGTSAESTGGAGDKSHEAAGSGPECSRSTRGKDATDSRFERAVLLLQSSCRRAGWRCDLLSLWRTSIHLVLSPPAAGSAAAAAVSLQNPGPIEQLLRSVLPYELNRAGIPGFVFPEGCQLDDLGFCLERSLDFDRQQRVDSGPSAGLVRLYPAAVATPEAVSGHVQLYLDRVAASQLNGSTDRQNGPMNDKELNGGDRDSDESDGSPNGHGAGHLDDASPSSGSPGGNTGGSTGGGEDIPGSGLSATGLDAAPRSLLRDVSSALSRPGSGFRGPGQAALRREILTLERAAMDAARIGRIDLPEGSRPPRSSIRIGDVISASRTGALLPGDADLGAAAALVRALRGPSDPG